MKRSVKIDGHSTSISIEDEFWGLLKIIADSKKISIQKMVAEIDKERTHSNLSAAVRIYVLKYAVSRSSIPGKL